DTDGAHHAPAGDAVGQVAQERALADAGLAAQNGDPTSPGENVGQQTVDCLAFGPPSKEAHPRPLCVRSPSASDSTHQGHTPVSPLGQYSGRSAKLSQSSEGRHRPTEAASNGGHDEQRS